MSVPVDVDELADALRDRPFGYLLTVTDDQRPHAVAVTPSVQDGVLTFSDGLGRRTRAHLLVRPDVTLLWPPTAAGGYTLIADGRITVSGDVATFVPGHAVLHRPVDAAAPVSVGSSGCGSDCVPVGEV